MNISIYKHFDERTFKNMNISIYEHSNIWNISIYEQINI